MNPVPAAGSGSLGIRPQLPGPGTLPLSCCLQKQLKTKLSNLSHNAVKNGTELITLDKATCDKEHICSSVE